MMPERLVGDNFLNSVVVAAFLAGSWLSAFYISNNLTLLPVSSMVLVFVSLTTPIVLIVIGTKMVMERLALSEHVNAACVFTIILYSWTVLRLPILEINFVNSFLQGVGGLEGNLSKILFLIFGLLLAFLIAFVAQKYVILLTVPLIVMNSVATLSTATSIIDPDGNQVYTSEIVSALDHISLKMRPNIYFVLADGYGSFAYMHDNGVDVSGFEEFLFLNEFSIYDEVFSNYQPTAVAMPAILNMTHHYYEIGRKAHEVSKSGRAVIGGNNNLVKVLKKAGYHTQYTHQSTYLLLSGCTADNCYPEVSFAGAKTVLFRIVPNFLTSKRKSEFPPFEEVQDEIIDLMALEREPRFNYTHVFEPGHSANEVQGRCEEAIESHQYGVRVQETNFKLQVFIAKIISNDPNAVIVLTGDHGPMITEKCNRNADLDTIEGYRDRAGVALAIRWPDSYTGKYDDRIKSSINIFRYVLASLFEDDAEILQTRVPDDVYIQGRDGFLRILNDGEVLFPPEHFTKAQMRQKYTAAKG